VAGAAWHPDPTRRHEYRYYDGVWTEWVADGGRTGTDALTAPPQPHIEPQRTDERAVASPAEWAAPPPSLPAEWAAPPPSLPAEWAAPPPSLPAEWAAPPPSSPVVAGDPGRSLRSWTDERMRVAASWVNRRGGQSRSGPPMLDSTDSTAVLGQWSGLAEAVTKYAMAVSGVAAGGELLGVLHAISRSDDAQSRLLHRIDAKVDAILNGPYNTGRTHLLEAQRVGGDEASQHAHIVQAKDCFYLAHGQAGSVQSRALVEYHLGLSWLLLDRPGDATHWLAQSHQSAVAVVHELAHQTRNVQVLRSRTTTAAASYFYPAGLVVLGMKFKKVVAAEQARQALLDFLPFVACSARSHNSLVSPEAFLPSLHLVPSQDGAYDLVTAPT